jgi:hypothetical protein
MELATDLDMVRSIAAQEIQMRGELAADATSFEYKLIPHLWYTFSTSYDVMLCSL